MSEIEQPIMEYIAGVVAETGGGAVTRDTQLLEAGVLDSINLVRLVQFIEERFKISIPDSDFGPELFESPATVSAYVARRAA
jgi:acyl carrier protein